ncbi:RAI1-domain-containing protein [Trametopsis cervina]|nr:RAI1-domain-containing protein [Trametopsis cervina]
MSPSKRPISEVDVEEQDVTARATKRRVNEVGNVVSTATTKVETHDLKYPPTSGTVKPVAIQYPSRLLSFSYDPNRTLLFDDSAMKYFVNPPANADLRYGYSRWVKRPEEKGRIDGLLRAVAKYAESLDSSTDQPTAQGVVAEGKVSAQWLRQIKCVSWRGVMTKILTAPYETRDGWELNVMHINDTLYLEEHLSDKRLAEKEDMTPHHRQQSYYGYSFESFCTSSHPRKPETLPGHPPGWSGDVNTNVQWCSVVKTKLASHRLLIGGEVDCVKAKQDTASARNYTPEDYVELKTSMSIRGPHDEVKFEQKLLKFYFQSFLLGVPEIIVGFRTPQGRVVTTQAFKTKELPRLVRGKPHAWDPHICMQWGDTFLNFLQERVPNRRKGETPQVWRAKFTPGEGVKMTQLDTAGRDEVKAGEDRVGFLPRWYFESLTSPEKEDE